MGKDWTGNHRSIYVTLGASNYSVEERQENDYYATEPKAAELLLKAEDFSGRIWECACGEGHLAKVFEQAGKVVYATDLIDRGYGYTADFLKTTSPPLPGFDIITNPPYSKAAEFVDHALEIIEDGRKVAMFLKLQFLEGKSRKALFQKWPPQTVYVSSSRLVCAKNGDFEKYKNCNAVAYAWYVWRKGYDGETVIKWIN